MDAVEEVEEVAEEEGEVVEEITILIVDPIMRLAVEKTKMAKK